jgi:ribosome biogenesis protein YTM1
LSDEHEGVEVPAWVGSLNCSVAGRIFAGCFDGKVQLLDASTLAIISQIDAHVDPVTCIDVLSGDAVPVKSSPFYPYEDAIASIVCTGSKDQTLKCFAVNAACDRSSQISMLLGHTASVESVRYDQRSNILLSGDWSGNLLGWDLRGLLEDSNGSNNNDVEEGSSKKKIKSKSGVAKAAVPPKEMKNAFFIRAHSQSVSSIIFSSSNNRVFTSSWDHSVREWDLETQDCVVTMAGSKVITSCDYSALAQLVATSHPDGRIRMWDHRQPDGASACVNSFGSKTDVHWINQVGLLSHIFFMPYLREMLYLGIVESDV